MGRGGDSSEGQNNLEGESMRPNSPLGDTWKMMMISSILQNILYIDLYQSDLSLLFHLVYLD